MSVNSSASKGGQFITPSGFGIAVPNPFNFASNQLRTNYSSLHVAALSAVYTKLSYAIDLPSNVIFTQLNLTVTTAFNGTSPTIQFSSFDPNLTAAATPTVTPAGVTGSSTWSYKITALAPDSALSNQLVASQFGWSLGSAAGTSTSGNAVLTNANYNALTWTAYSNATQYAIYRTAAPAGYALGLIGYSKTNSFIDSGMAPIPQYNLLSPQGQLSPVANTLLPIAAGDLFPAGGSLGSLGGSVSTFSGIQNQSPYFLGVGIAQPVQRFYIVLSIGGSTAGAVRTYTQFHVTASQASSTLYSE